MRRFVLTVLALAILAEPGFARSKRKSGRPIHRVVRKSSATRKSSARRTKAGVQPVTARGRYRVPSGPTPDRYREIQQALAQRGYYKGEVNGTWSPESAEALKRFQEEQNLTSDGKLNSLSLIALGLGPKRSASFTAPALAAKPGVQP